MPEPAHDALDALRARLEETRLHAERLAQEAAEARRRAEQRTDQEPGADEAASSGEPAGPAPIDLQSVAALLETLRELVPPELQQQLAEVTRQVLLLLRALIDWWVDRLEPPSAGGSQRAGSAGSDGPVVQDIPVR